MKKKRFLIKLSGEILKESLSPLSWNIADKLCKELAILNGNGNYEIAFVIGGGNIFRGASGDVEGYDRRIGDHIGMMATVINGLALYERFRSLGVTVTIQSGLEIPGLVGKFNADDVEKTFASNGVVIFCGGIGNPYFSTDMTAVLRALEINADCIFKATKVDGVFDKDPVKHKDAVKYDKITFSDIIEKRLRVMDLPAIQLCQENRMPLMIFDMVREGNLKKACSGERVGTFVEE